MAALVTILFFASGMAGLAYQIVWVRALGLVVGATLWSAVAVVAAYMGGMAVGSALVARYAARLRAHLRWYAAAEAAAAAVALATPPAIAGLARVASGLGPEPLGTWGLPLAGRFLLAWSFLALPTVAMGATLPLLVERVRGSGIGGRVARLYAANTFGAVAGVLSASFVTLPVVGERATLAAFAGLGLAVAGLAWLLETRVPARRPLPGGATDAGPGVPLAVPALLGFVALACELVWTRVLVLHLGSRVYAFALILAVFLVGLAGGSALVRGRDTRPAARLAVLQAIVAVGLALQVVALGGFSDLLGWLAAALRPEGFVGLQATLLLATAALLLPPTLAFGASFPLAVAACSGTGGDTARTGRVAAANTLGAIAGTIAAPLVLVPLVGTQRLLLLLASASLGVALWLAPSRRLRLALAPALLAPLLVWVVLPEDHVLRTAGVHEDGAVETIAESASATVVVRRIDDARGGWRSLELNGVNVAGTSPELRAIQRLQGHLPLLLHPDPRRILHIGFGSGGTAFAVSQHPVEEIRVAEISPEVLSVSDTVFGEVNRHVLADPRVAIVLNDGRNVLLASAGGFDAILSDSIHPVYAGNSALYTREYFELCRERLRDGGVVSMWLPMYSLTRESYLAILRAFWEVFPETCVWYDPVVVNEFTVVTGRVRHGPVAVRWDAVGDPRLAATLAEAGVAGAADLATMLLLGPEQVARLVAGSRPHLDDLPEVEYRSGRLIDREGSWLDNFAMLVEARSAVLPFAATPFAAGAVVARRDGVLFAHLKALQVRVASTTTAQSRSAATRHVAAAALLRPASRRRARSAGS